MILLPENGFTQAREQQEVDKLISQALEIWAMLAHPSRRVEELMGNQAPQFITFDRRELSEVYLTAAFQELKKGGEPLWAEDVLMVQYVCDFVQQLVSGALEERRQDIPKHPYVHEYLEKRDYQTAGDTALYGYWFLQEKRHNELNGEDYLHMAEQS